MEKRIRSLRKVTADGRPYARPAAVEEALARLSDLSARELASALRDGGVGGVRLPSECLVHVARSAARDGRASVFAAAWRRIEARLARRFPAGRGGGPVSGVEVDVREAVVGRLGEMIARDVSVYCEALDYYEVRFDSAVSSAVSDARRTAHRRTARHRPFTDSEGEVRPEALAIAEQIGSGDRDVVADRRYAALDVALPTLPPVERRIVELLLAGRPVDSSDPAVPSIARTLGRSERSVRSRRDAAFARIRRVYERGGPMDRTDTSLSECREAGLPRRRGG